MKYKYTNNSQHTMHFKMQSAYANLCVYAIEIHSACLVAY